MKLGKWLGLGMLLAVAATASAAPIEVGTGVNEARVYIEWADGFSIEFLVHFGQTEAETTTGVGLLDIIEAETELVTERVYYDQVPMIDGIAYEDHNDVGYGGGALWWHYWTDESGSRDAWISPWTGAADRIVRHGDADGWIYGRDNAPEPQWELPFLSGYGRYVYDANDFATSWIDYQPRGMMNDWLSGEPYNDPNVALGRPTVDTTGDDWIAPTTAAVPVVPVYPAFRSHELVFLGKGGSLTLVFNHPVRDDVLNPYGIDFLVFGNTCQAAADGQYLDGAHLADVIVGSSDSSEPGVVSVSQDGVTWYSFTNDPNFMVQDANFIKLPAEAEDGPFCDGFAPTLGRVCDPCNVDASLGDTNLWWAEPTNPTLPLDPAVSGATLSGRSVARVAQTYGDSAGGTGYDIARLDLPVDPNTQLKWFQYIRIDDAAAGGEPEIDAVADVSCPGDYRHPAPLGDVNGDFRVDEKDLDIVIANQGKSISDPEVPPAADLDANGIVDEADRTIVESNMGAIVWGQV
ncbi:MAG: dockerin type I domain-containing protein [Phycisphaerales bacterium]